MYTASSTLGVDSHQYRTWLDVFIIADGRRDRATRWLRAASIRAKREFFDNVLKKADTRLISGFTAWAKPRKLDAGMQIKRADGTTVNSPEELQEEFQEQFTPSVPKPTDETILEEITQKDERSFPDISLEEISENLADTSNTSVGGEDHINWMWCKSIFHMIEHIKDNDGRVVGVVHWGPKVYAFFKAYYNACIRLHKFPSAFKRSITVVIPKPNKPDYSKAKAYRPICLLSVFGKLLEKILAARMQFDGQKYGVLHPCQFGGVISTLR